MTTAGRDRRGTDGAPGRREANDAGQIPLDQPGPAAPRTAAERRQCSGQQARRTLATLATRRGTGNTGAGAGGRAGCGRRRTLLSEMAKIAWDTGVTQREQDTAKKLQQPQAGQPELTDAVAQGSTEAMGAVDSIGTQVGALDPARKTRSDVHFNAILQIKNMAVVALGA